MAEAKKRTAATPLSRQRGSNKRVNTTNLVVTPSLTGPKVESVKSASHDIQPEASSATATTALPELKESNAVYSTTIPAAKSEDSSVLSKHPGKNFMDLPRELRDLIYYHALVPLDSASSRPKRKEQAPIRLALLSRLEWNRLNREMANLGMAFPNTHPELSPRINIALFCTNHTLRAEAEAVFYKHNAFTLRASWFWSSRAIARRPLPADALSKLRKLYVGHWGGLMQESAGSTRVAPVWMDEAREARIRAVAEVQKGGAVCAHVMDQMCALTDFLAALPVLRELTINYNSFITRFHRTVRGAMERLVVGRLYDKMKERPELGLPLVRVHLCGLAMGYLQGMFEWSQWYKPSDCTACMDRDQEASRA